MATSERLHYRGDSDGFPIVKPSFLLFAGMACLSPQATAQPSPAPALPAEKPNAIPQPPPKLEEKSVPTVTEWLKDTRGKVIERSEKAYRQGPDALEKLAHQLQTAELKDEDGRYTTPYFFKNITGSDAPRSDEFWGDYQKRLFAEWRKRHPESKAAILAEGRMYLQLARAYRDDQAPLVDVNRKWETVMEHYAKAKVILNECRDLQSKDPAWAVSYLPLLDDVDEDAAEFEKEARQTIKDFPDSGFALSRAAWGMRKKQLHFDPGWDIWLRKELAAAHPPEVAAKAYALTLGELAALQAFYDWGMNGRTIQIDPGLLTKGLDLLLKQYPDSPAISSTNIVLSAHTLLDRKRTQAAIKQAKGRIDVIQIKHEYWYREAIRFMTSFAWKPEVVGLPPVTKRIYERPAELTARIEKAAEEGPRALEELIQNLRSQDPIDKDGVHPSIYFFDWFGEGFREVAEYREAERKAKLLEAWKLEFPASPFARLASAYHGIDLAWDARSSSYGYKVSDVRWEEFRNRLKNVREDLEASRELQESEPAWSVVATTYCLGASDDEWFAELSKEFFRHFPECDRFLDVAESHFMPKWGGKPGSWEPWLREMLKDQPEDVRAAAYARGVMTFIGYIEYERDNKEEMLGTTKLDMKLIKDGFRELRKKYPDSNRIDNMEALWACYLTDDYQVGYDALKRMNGTLDMNVWFRYDVYDRAVRWVTWKKSSEK